MSEAEQIGVGPLVSSERVADYLRRAILAGEFAPGERIRQEDIAARLGASRLPVREALRMLAAEGLTEHTANKGSRVPMLDPAELDVVYRMRERLEPLALSESLRHITDAQVDRLEQIQVQIEHDTDLTDFLLLDREFHLLCYAGCRAEQLNSAVLRLWNSTQHYRRAFMQLGRAGGRGSGGLGAERMAIVNAEHRLLLEAIRRRDAETAQAYVAVHIGRTRAELLAHPEVFVPH